MQYSPKKIIEYLRLKDIAHLFLLLFVLPWALIAKIFIRDFWLICEDANEARDNGYWLFKWIRTNHPEQKVAYAINKKSDDHANVKGLGKIVGFGTLSHWFWYIVADKNISSQKNGKPNAAVCYLFEVVFKMRKNNRVFLQHGITKDDAEWLYYTNCMFRLFVCGAKPEYEYIKERFGYPERNIVYTGFCRFDGLHDGRQKGNGNRILVMPTWREWLARASKSSDEKQLFDSFDSSVYYKKWSEFLQSERLDKLLSDNKCTLLFYPHRNMQPFLYHFRKLCLPTTVEIADPSKVGVQQALNESDCLITDYSSVFFDVAYMRKQVVFYQFDEAEYRSKKDKVGYFDNRNNLIWQWSATLDDCLDLVENAIASGFVGSDTVDDFFPLYDRFNCKRNYEAIKQC